MKAQNLRWSLQVSLGLPWSLLVSTCRSPLVPAGLSWSVLASAGLYWSPLVFATLHRSPLVPAGLSWSLLVSPGLYRSLAASLCRSPCSLLFSSGLCCQEKVVVTSLGLADALSSSVGSH